jgi:predicted short-subunit dehydrogenase-like oxidoreductase (DUF2520 family)
VPSFAEALVATDLVVLAVDDRAIGAVAREIAKLRPSWRGVTVLHAAGALTPSVLAPLARRGPRPACCTRSCRFTARAARASPARRPASWEHLWP